MELFEILLYAQTGEGEVFQTYPIEIPGLEGARPLTLYLPPDYHLAPERNYAIAYFFDGQNLYEGQQEGPPGWNLHGILDARFAAGLEVPIAVGIHHGWNRDEELCPWPAEQGQVPRGDLLLDWLIHTLHPQLSEQLRLDDRPEQRLIGGSSLGGLLALYAGFRHSDFFGKVMSMSPALWVGNGAIYDYIAKADLLYNLDFLRLYIDCGAYEDIDDEAAWSDDFWDEANTGGEANEDEDSLENNEEWDTDPLEDAEYLIDILEAKGFENGVHFLWVPDPEGEHNEWHWRKRLPLALAWLFEDL